MDPGNFSFFVLPGIDPEPMRRAIDTDGNPIRKRQPHRKSRAGCATCKRRKVKCDERLPACHNCRRRNLNCSFTGPSPVPETVSEHKSDSGWASALSPKSLLELAEGRSGDPRCFSAICTGSFPTLNEKIEEVEVVGTHGILARSAALNMSAADRELLQHFETFTSWNLALSDTQWHTKVLNFAFQCDYLMSTILLVAAAHINHNLPEDDPRRRNALHHFSIALSGLRTALATEITVSSSEYIISCTVLLIHYSWTSTWTCIDSQLNGGLDLGMAFRQIVSHLHGLKDCLVVTYDLFLKTEWAAIMMYSPKASLARCLLESGRKVDELEAIFAHTVFCGLGTKIPANASADNAMALTRLVIPMSVICLNLPDFKESHLKSDVYRYLFTWPTMCTKGFVQQVNEGNLTSLTILLYYYAAIVSVHSEKIWWMRDGATYMYRTLRSKLDGCCDRCTTKPLALFGLSQQ